MGGRRLPCVAGNGATSGGWAEGERLIDVGCGLGDAALALADDLGTSGQVVGIDISTSMLSVARERAKAAACQVRFSVGDAISCSMSRIDPSTSPGPSARCSGCPIRRQPSTSSRCVLRPGGRLCLIDTDWSTLRLDIGDTTVAEQVCAAMRTERGRPSNVGSRLDALARTADFDVLAATSATQVWRTWDPDESIAPGGCFSMRSLAEDLVSTGQLDVADTDRFVDRILHAARNGRFEMSLTMFAVVATAAAR